RNTLFVHVLSILTDGNYELQTYERSLSGNTMTLHFSRGLSARGGCPSQAGVKGVGTALMSSMSSKAPRTSIVNSSPESTVIVGGVWVLTEKRYSVRFALMCRSPFVADARAGQQHNRRVGAIWSLALPERRLGSPR